MIISLNFLTTLACANYKIILTFKRDQKGSFISSRFFENQPKEICSHLREKTSKAGFLNPRSSKITVTKAKERRKRKSDEKERRRRKKSNGCTRSFCNTYFGKKMLDAKGPFGGNVFKIRLDINKWATITKEVYTQLYPKIATIVYSKYSAVSDWFKFPG